MFDTPIAIINGSVTLTAVMVLALVGLELYSRATAPNWEKVAEEKDLKVVK